MTDAFSRIIGHERVVQRLRTMLAHGALPHAIVLHGPRHAGKTALALVLASALLGVEDATKHPDFRFVGRPRDEKTDKLKKAIPIESVRELQQHLRMSAFLGGAKAACIEGADRLSEEAANALLKTLEEPAPRTFVFLCAEELARLPKTITSRAAVFRLGRVAEAAIASALVSRGASSPVASDVSVRADGRPGLALAFAEQADMLHWHETEERRWRSLRAAPPHRRLAECAALAPARADREETVERLRDVCDVWQGFLRRELRAGEAAAAPNVRRLQALRASLDANVQPRLLLEKFVLTLDRSL